ncbi:MAG TPA: YlmH/Sll1252 family protein [Clostridia bacterium]|nr:YlmH/Sll1252 family protein [Clostridia bacterium]
MNKQLILDKYKKFDDRILVARLFDKIEICIKTNKIVCLDFLDPSEIVILKNVLNSIKIKNYIFFGGTDDYQRAILIVYPEKMEDFFKNGNFDFNSVVKVIRIVLPQHVRGTYDHKIYLGGIIKLGVKRTKIGDILTDNEGADIIVCSDICEFLLSNLIQLKRFSKAIIEEVELSSVKKVVQKFEELKIIVSSLRLDNVVAEIAGKSRNKANEILSQERVFVNYESETKPTKLIKENDTITIRGKGKFLIGNILGTTKSGKIILSLKRFL